MSKVLFFTAKAKPTTAEATAIARLTAKGYDVKVRNGSATNAGLFDAHKREACDAVAGTIPAGYQAVKATLQFDGGFDYDAALEATTAGAAGNDISVKLVGDSAPGAGVSIVRVGTAFTIHFEKLVSTVANVNTAVSALGGADDLFGVAANGSVARVLTARAARAATKLAYGGDALSDVTLPPVAKPETFKVFPPTVSLGAAGTLQLRAINAEQNESTGAITLTDEAADAGTTYGSADETKCTVGATGLITRQAAGGAGVLVTATRESVAAIKASLACAAVPGCQLDTVVEAHTAGTAGNALSLALVSDDTVLKAGTIARDTNAFTVKYKPSVSTIADVEALIAALGGGDDLIDVKTGGTGATVLDKNAGFTAQLLSGGAAAVTSTSTCAVTTT